ncbi:MAG: hypothetical protein KDA88_20070, partial [Planctomycetaceae bacterium]|nr:hypothetical protein [Planctomycetaceae bacterium]
TQQKLFNNTTLHPQITIRHHLSDAPAAVFLTLLPVFFWCEPFILPRLSHGGTDIPVCVPKAL